MKTVKIFVKADCPRCPGAKNLGEQLAAAGFPLQQYDVETADGLAEASFYRVMATPTIIVVDDDEEVLADWRGEVPPPAAVARVLSGG